MDRRLALTAVIGVFVAGLFAIVSTADRTPLARRAPSIPFGLPTVDFSAITVPPTTTPVGVQPTGTSEPSRGWDLLVSLTQFVIAVIALALVAWALRAAWRSRPHLQWRRRHPPPRFTPLDDIAATIVADADAQTATLHEGRARNAIVHCWSRLEHLVADSGCPVDPADTPSEFTVRVLAAHTLDRTALDELLDLYREARFSTHDLGEHERTAAIHALERLHADLGRRPDAAAAP